MKRLFNFAAFAAVALSLILAGCKHQDPEDSLEAFIKTIQITNGGISGGDLITGTVDNEAFVVTFDEVAAETNIAAIKFKASLSLGAKLDAESYDFTEGNDINATSLTRKISVINDTKVQDYNVIINLKPAESAPVIEKIVMKDAAGAEHTLTAANIMDGILCLGMAESETAELVSIVLSPARATYVFDAMADNKLQASNPGKLTLDFMGLTNEYEISFAASPVPGADWSKAIVHDFTIVTGNRYIDFDEEFTRGGDFDGEYVLLANRTAPKLFAARDLLNDNLFNPILLNTTGIEGGVYSISAGRLAQGHIYICNLTTGAGGADDGQGPLKVYHYASPTATPEVVLSWDGTGITNSENDYTGRIGDNISIWLDASGNGYAFFAKQEADNKMFRFTVTGFTKFSEPYEITLPAVANYYGMMNQVGPDQYLFTSSYVPMLWLFDHDGNVLREFEWLKVPEDDDDTREPYDVAHACDPRVVTFNRARYLVMTNAHRFNWWADEAVTVFDITDGNDMVSAMVKMQDAQDNRTLAPCFNYQMPSAEISSACVALSGMAEVDGKLVIWTAAPHVGMALIEVPKM